MVRRQAALERLLLRLIRVAPDRWALKGGLALDTGLGDRARVSIDLDADHVHGAYAARADLQRAAIEDVGDHFGFAVVGSEELRDAGVGLAVGTGWRAASPDGRSNHSRWMSRSPHLIPGRLNLCGGQDS
jgi:hypothetical protein